MCVCAYHCVQLSYTTQHRTVLMIFPLILQTTTIAQMLSTANKQKSENSTQPKVVEVIYLFYSHYFNLCTQKKIKITSTYGTL